MEPIECSETLAIRTQTPGNYPKENILQEKVVLRHIRNHQLNMSDVTLLFILSVGEGRVQSLNVRSRAGLNTTKYILWHP